MTRSFAFAAVFAAVTLAASPSAMADVNNVGSIDGIWRNAKNSLHIEVKPCSEGTCGYVVWASEKAQEDARKGGTEKLVGMQILREFVPDKRGSWRGRVFVPDLNAIFRGTAEMIDRGTLRARGCLLVNIICKSQIWTRVDGAAG